MSLITTIAVAAGLFALAQCALLAQGTKARSELEWPPVTREMRPWTRWWWLGSAVDRPNISSLLATYHRAGLGGVEITPIYGVKGQDARELTYLSPEWVAMLKHTIVEASRLDMGVDMPTGTGWPFGGPQVTDADAQDKMAIEATPVAGGAEYVLPRGRGSSQALVAVSGDDTINLTGRANSAEGLRWVAPAGGAWTVYRVTHKWSGRGVKRAAPGGGGKCINPFSRDSLEHYLIRFDSPMAELPPGGLRCQFHDSFEYGADWMPTLFEEFRKRRHYDLREHLPAFVNAGDPDHARVRTDYRETIGELLLEDFTQPWTAWSHAKGSKTRNQAHGSPGNLIDLYAAVDIPETEVFRSIGDLRVTKFASSAAHLMGKPLASSESCTWQSEHFTETLGVSKRTLDRLMAGGINHIFYHGTAYSPADAPWPGWLFYASTHFEPNNPTWHDFPALNAYVTRCQSILQGGRPDNDVLLYWPLHDLWQKRPELFGLTIEGRWLEGEPVGAVAQTLLDRGYAYDYISDSKLRLATAKGGLVMMPGGAYRVVLVPPCHFMPVETLSTLLELARQGATVLFAGGLPEDVPGLGDLKKRRAQLSALVADLHREPTGMVGVARTRVGKGQILVGRDVSALLEAGRVPRESLCDHHGLMFLRRQSADGHDYFIVNQGNEPLDGWIDLARPAASAILMDPITGTAGVAALRPGPASTGVDRSVAQVYLQIPPGGSIIVRTLERRRVSGPGWMYTAQRAPIPLGGAWSVQFTEGGPVFPKSIVTDLLGSWTAQTDVEAQRFAGTARYSLTFDAPSAPADSWMLDLGDVRESARVRLNGNEVGTLLLAPWQMSLGKLRSKGNVLEVDVTSVAANRIRDMDRRGVPWRIFKEINFVNIDYKPFDASNWRVRDCGLLGPVHLIPLHRLHPLRLRDSSSAAP